MNTERKAVGIVIKNLAVGGAEKQEVILANALASEFKVYFIIFNNYADGQSLLDDLSDAVEVVILNGSFSQKIKQGRRLIREKKIDFLIAYLTGANFFSALLAKGTKAKVIAGISSCRLKLHKHLSDLIVNRWLSKVTVSNSYDAKKWFSRLGFNPDKIVIIRNSFSGVKPVVKPTVGSTINLITAARFVREKDYLTSIKALNELAKTHPNFRFRLVGYGPLEAKLRNWISRYNLQDKVDIIIQPDNVQELLKESQIYLCSSIYEGTSNSILEAMHNKLAIVATNVGDNANLIIEGKGGYLAKKGDYMALARQLARLMDHPELIKQFGEYNHEKVNSEFSAEAFKESFTKLLYS